MVDNRDKKAERIGCSQRKVRQVAGRLWRLLSAQAKLLTRSIWISCLLCILLTMVNTKVFGASYTYVIKSDSTTDTPQKRHYYLYLPSNLASGTYLCRNYSSDINPITSLNVRPYPIVVKYLYHLDNPEDDVVNNLASLTISSCSSSGEIIPETTNTIKIDQGATTNGSVIVNSNEGVIFDFYTGQWYWRRWYGEHENRAFTGYVEITFHLDEAPPDPPVLKVKNYGEPGVAMVGTKIHVQNQVILEWDTPTDHATVLEDQTIIGPGMVTNYKLDIYQDKSLIRSIAIAENASGNTFAIDLPEGEYLLQLRAYDFDGNESPASNSINLVVDRSVAPVDLSPAGVSLDGNNLTALWKPVADQSDIREYQVALTTSKVIPGEAQLTTTEARAAFTDLSPARSYFVWVRAVDQVGNCGSWVAAGPFNLSGEPVKLNPVPKAFLGYDQQPRYQVTLYIHSTLAGSYLIERQTEGASDREVVAELTAEQLAQNGYQIVDDKGLTSHGSYRYYVKHQTAAGSCSYQSEPVVIPNLPAGFTVIGPEHQTTTENFNHKIDITPKSNVEGDTLKFRVWYRSGQGQVRSSGFFADGPVTVTFPTAGTWEWWVEVGEFHNNQLIAKHCDATGQVLMIRSSTAYLADGTKVAKDQPRYEDSAPGFGKAVRIEYLATVLPTNPFFAAGVDDWTLAATGGAEAAKASIAGGLFGGKLAQITISKPGLLTDQIQFYKTIGMVKAGTKIACQIRARASAATNAIVFKCWNDSVATESFGSRQLNLTTEFQTFKLLAVATSEATARIGLELGNLPAGTSVEVDYICCETGKVHPTSPHDSKRSLENLKVATVGMSPTAGTWEQLVYIDPVVKRKGVTLYNRIFAIPQANGNAGINVYHATGSSVWDLETFNDAGQGSWLPKPISDEVTKENQWYRFRVTWSATEARLQIFEILTGTLVAEGKINKPKLPTAFGAYAYVGNMGIASFPETLHDDIRISDRVRTDWPDYTKPLPVDADTIFKLNLDGTLEPEFCQPAVRTLTIQAATVNEVTLPLFLETRPGQPLQLAAEVNLLTQVVEYCWNPGDGGKELYGPNPVYTYTQAGEYPLTLKVTDATGKVYTATATVKVCNSTSGTLVTDETWSGTQLLSGEVVVAAGKTLTVQAGTVIYLAAGTCLKIEGNLQAVDLDNGIVLTTEDGSLWEGIVIGGSGTVNLNGVTIKGAKTGIACTGTGQVNLTNTSIVNCQTGLHAYSGTIKADSCLFKQNRIYGVKEDNGCNPVLTNCRFQSNGIPYYDQQLYYLTAAQLNTGSNSGNSFSDQ